MPEGALYMRGSH